MLTYLVAELVQEINPKKIRQFSVIHAIFDDFSKFRSAFGILLLLTKIIKGKSLKKSLVQHNIPSTHFLWVQKPSIRVLIPPLILSPNIFVLVRHLCIRYWVCILAMNAEIKVRTYLDSR